MSSINMELLTIAIVGAAAAQAMNMFWYSPKVLGDAWMKEAGLKQKDCKDCGKKGLVTFITNFATAVTLILILNWAGAVSAKAGFVVGAWVSMGILATTLACMNLWEGRSIRYFMITGGNAVLSIILMSTLMAELISKFYTAG